MEATREERHNAVAAAYDMLRFSAADDLLRERTTGTWREYTYSDTFIDEKRRGKHPGSWRGFLEGHAWDRKELGENVTASAYQKDVDLYAWAVGLGLDIQQIAFIGAGILVSLYTRFKEASPETQRMEVANAVAIKEQHGRYYLPSLESDQKRDRPKFVIEVQEPPEHPGHYKVVAINVYRNGARQRNIIDKEAIHYLCRIMKAQTVLSGGE